MRSKNYEATGYMHDLELLITPHILHVSYPPSEKWVLRERYPNNTHLP